MNAIRVMWNSRAGFPRTVTLKLFCDNKVISMSNTTKCIATRQFCDAALRKASPNCFRPWSEDKAYSFLLLCHNVLSNSSSFTFCQKRWKRTKITEDMLPEIAEEDLEESFIRGTGPGGQAVNKTSNCVLLMHKPTKVFVKCHETRSLEDNRKRARMRLRQKLDYHFNLENSVQEVVKRQGSLERKLKRQRTNTRLEKLKAFKEREGID